MASHLKQPLIAGLLALGLIIPAVCATAQTPPPAQTVNPATIVAKGTGFTITEADIAAASEDPNLDALKTSGPNARDTLIDYLVDLKVLALAGEKAKLDHAADFASKMAYAKSKLLASEYLETEIKKVITPEAVKALYADYIKKLEPEQEIRAQHILVKSEEEAAKLIARIKAGEDFGKVLEDASKDADVKAKSGDLGFFTKDMMVPEFGDAAFKLEVGQVSTPVKTPFGWHVIKVEEKRVHPAPTLEEIKSDLESVLVQQKQREIFKTLREEAKVERLDKPVDAPAPGAPADAVPVEKK